MDYMPITPYHLILNYLVYLGLMSTNVIPANYYLPLWMMFASNLIDLDHLFRYFYGESPIVEQYGLNHLFFHGWWTVLPISILSMIPACRWFALGWALHILLDGLMITFKLNSWLIPIKSYAKN